ncbi:hypothetical protein [Nonlabens antarcticus]|uniref:hypothetical protein n=1 Tax=Nonlabens antarcticus TaxID=392714 RepID=UPI0018916F48|nr:hypothetical protein [Nonlabens antarcticus]
MKYFIVILVLLVTLSGCNNIRSVTYTQPIKFKKNVLYLRSGSYASLQPDVPSNQINEATTLLDAAFTGIAGECYSANSSVKNLKLKLAGNRLSNYDINQIRHSQPTLDYVIILSSAYKEPVVTEFYDSRRFRSPEEHVTGILSILDIKKNQVIYSQTLEGSTEDRYNAFDPNGDEEPSIVFKAKGELLTTKVLKRLIKNVAKYSNAKKLSCN